MFTFQQTQWRWEDMDMEGFKERTIGLAKDSIAKYSDKNVFLVAITGKKESNPEELLAKVKRIYQNDVCFESDCGKPIWREKRISGSVATFVFASADMLCKDQEYLNRFEKLSHQKGGGRFLAILLT